MLRVSLQLLLPLLLLASASGASAQVPVLDMQSTLYRTTEDGCSQSYATSSVRTDLHLTVDSAGDASLKLFSESDDFIGPSYGAWSQGQRGSTQTTSLERHAWTGRATALAGGAIRLAFDQDTTSNVIWQGPGSLPLPAPRALAVNLVIDCQPTTLAVYPRRAPAAPAPGQRGGASTPIAGYRCTVVSGAPRVLEREATEPLPFAPGVPLRRDIEDGMLIVSSGPVLRRR